MNPNLKSEHKRMGRGGRRTRRERKIRRAWEDLQQQRHQWLHPVAAKRRQLVVAIAAFCSGSERRKAYSQIAAEVLGSHSHLGMLAFPTMESFSLLKYWLATSSKLALLETMKNGRRRGGWRGLEGRRGGGLNCSSGWV